VLPAGRAGDDLGGPVDPRRAGGPDHLRGHPGAGAEVVPWSFVGDRIGRLRAMVIAVLSATVLGLVAAWAPTFPLVLALRFLEGAALGGVPALAMAYLSEEMAPRARALGAGWFVAGT